MRSLFIHTMTRALSSSVRGRLMVLVTSIVVPMMLLAAVLIAGGHRNERATVEQRLSETAHGLVNSTGREFGQSLALLRGLAASPELHRGDFDDFYEQARGVVQRDEWLVLIGQGGRQILNTNEPADIDLPDINTTPELVNDLRGGDTHITNLLRNVVPGFDGVMVSVPIIVDGETIYGLSLVKLPSNLNRMLIQQELPDEWVASVLDRDGVVVARSRNARGSTGRAVSDEFLRMMRTSDRGTSMRTDFDGRPVIAAFSRSASTGYTVVVTAPKNILHASAIRMLLLTLGLSALIVGLAVALSGWIGRGVASAVESIASDARALGEGKIPAARPTGMEETDSVAEALHTAAVQLKNREAELIRLSETLEERVRMRTSELSETNRLLELRNKELQEFAYAASHDLQEPLRKVTTFAGLLESEYGDKLDDDGRAYVERMSAAGMRMSQLLRDLLEFSRVSTHVQPARSVDVDDAAKLAINDLEIQLQEVGGRVDVRADVSVVSDPAQVQLLLRNLIGNALKFHRPDVPPEVSVEAFENDQNVHIVVADNGIGFDLRYIDKIFAPFQRLHGRSAYSGTGMGLAIVRRIVERHGGRIDVESTVGEGSRFEVVLPIREPEEKGSEVDADVAAA